MHALRVLRDLGNILYYPVNFILDLITKSYIERIDNINAQRECYLLFKGFGIRIFYRLGKIIVFSHNRKFPYCFCSFLFAYGMSTFEPPNPELHPLSQSNNIQLPRFPGRLMEAADIEFAIDVIQVLF